MTLHLGNLPDSCPGASSGRPGSPCEAMQDVAKLRCKSQGIGHTIRRRSEHVTKCKGHGLWAAAAKGHAKRWRSVSAFEKALSRPGFIKRHIAQYLQ